MKHVDIVPFFSHAITYCTKGGSDIQCSYTTENHFWCCPTAFAVLQPHICESKASPRNATPLLPLADTMHARAPELQPVLAPPGCQVKALGGASPSGSSTR